MHFLVLETVADLYGPKLLNWAPRRYVLLRERDELIEQTRIKPLTSKKSSKTQ